MRLHCIIFLCIVFAPNVLFAQELLPASKKIKTQYDYFVVEKKASLSQVDFITAFPDNKDTFLRVFYHYEYDQLYKLRREYLAALKRIAQPYPRMTFARLLPIACKLQGNQDIVGDLQDIIIGMANDNVKIFAEEAYKLQKQDLKGLGIFLAFAEDRAGVLKLARALGDNNEKKLVKMIEQGIKEKAKEAE